MKLTLDLFCSIMASTFIITVLLSPARANMMVYPMQTEVGVNGSAQLNVLSRSDEVQFVRITPKQIISPGTPAETEITVDMTADSALVVAPIKLALSAGSERIVRLVTMAPPPQETTWRIYFEGVKEALSPHVTGSDAEKKSTTLVGVSIIWGALVHVAPEHVTPSLKYNSQTGKFVNDGTIRLPLQEIAVCNTASDCTWKKETATVYPGTELRLSSVEATAGKRYRAKYYHWIKKTSAEIEIPALQVK